jgi:hypothetical protein
VILHQLGTRPAIQIVIALWATFAVLLAINLTLRLTPHEVQFIRQSPAQVQPTAPPAAPLAPTEAPVEVEPAPLKKSAPTLLAPPTAQRLAGVQTVDPAASPSPEQRTKAPATERQKSIPAAPAAPADPCAEACDDPVPAEQPSVGGEDVDPAVTPVPAPEPAPAPSGADPAIDD